MLEKFGGFEQEAKQEISDEEQVLLEKAHEAGGESRLTMDDSIRLITLRYMRGKRVEDRVVHEPLSEADAMELATIERYIDEAEAAGESKISLKVVRRDQELRKKLEAK